MRLSNLAMGGLGASLLLGCLDQGEVVVPNPFGTGGFVSSGGATAAAGSGTGGVGGMGGMAGAGFGGSAGAGGSATVVAPGPPVGGAPSAFGGDITEVAKSDGCGNPFAVVSGAKITLQTMGTKAADCADKLAGVAVCGAWSLPRDYYVNLPANYDITKAYPLVLEGPGCGGNGTNIWPLPTLDGIRIGITPGPNSTGHGTNENQGCFDDHEGDDSVDFVFYETLYDALNKQLCFDRNRVFATGNSSGGTLSNELGCKYAGDPLRPVRGTLAGNASFPIEPAFAPTCSSSPMAGMWVQEVMDQTHPFDNVKAAVTRAMSVNHCDMAGYDSAVFQDFPIGGGNPDNTCRKITGCDPLYPLVVCALPGNGKGSHDNVVNPGFTTFIKLFEQPPLLTPP
jgi:hypothetical protein